MKKSASDIVVVPRVGGTADEKYLSFVHDSFYSLFFFILLRSGSRAFREVLFATILGALLAAASSRCRPHFGAVRAPRSVLSHY
jgi:hypothetical protein